METKKEIHKTARALCDTYNISYSSYMYYRRNFPNASENAIIIRTGGTVQEGVQVYVGIEYKNVVYPTMKDLCTNYNTTYNLFQRNRIRYPKEGVEFWLTRATKSTKMYNINYKGKDYRSLTELCKGLGVRYKSVLFRKINYPDRGLDYWLYGRRLETIKYNDVLYDSYKELCKDIGINYTYFIHIRHKKPFDTLEDWVCSTRNRRICKKVV